MRHLEWTSQYVDLIPSSNSDSSFLRMQSGETLITAQVTGTLHPHAPWDCSRKRCPAQSSLSSTSILRGVIQWILSLYFPLSTCHPSPCVIVSVQSKVKSICKFILHWWQVTVHCPSQVSLSSLWIWGEWIMDNLSLSLSFSLQPLCPMYVFMFVYEVNVKVYTFSLGEHFVWTIKHSRVK